MREIGNDDEQDFLFLKPIFSLPKADYVKLVIDATFLNSITDLFFYSRPLELFQMLFTRVNGKCFIACDLPCAHHQDPLIPETHNLTSLKIGGKQFTNHIGFYGLRGLPSWLS